MLLILTQMVFFGAIHAFFNLAVEVYLKQHETFSTLKTMICRKYSFQKLTLFSQGYNVQDDPPSNTDFFFETYMRFFNLEEYECLEQNEPFSTFKTMIFRKYSCQALTNSHRETMW
jgi:hypothetical protein